MPRWAAVVLFAICFLLPATSSASPYLYTLSTDYTGISGLPAGSTVSWQFEVPSLLTATTTITSFMSASLGPGLSSCGGVLDAQLPLPAKSPYTSLVITDFTGSCFAGITGAGAVAFGNLNPGVHNLFQFSTGTNVGTLTIASVASVPEPTSLLLFGPGVFAILGGALRRKR